MSKKSKSMATFRMSDDTMERLRFLSEHDDVSQGEMLSALVDSFFRYRNETLGDMMLHDLIDIRLGYDLTQQGMRHINGQRVKPSEFWQMINDSNGQWSNIRNDDGTPMTHEDFIKWVEKDGAKYD